MDPSTSQLNPNPKTSQDIPGPQWDTPDGKLPSRLFATGRYPVASLNLYAKLEHLTFLHHHLKDSPVFDQIRKSCFGKLFDIPSPRCPTSGKLIHQLITRQLLTKQKHEMWMVFGGQPFRFGLPEFEAITGLPCGEFEEDCIEEVSPPLGTDIDATWREIVSDNPNTTIDDIATLFKKPEEMESMTDDRKFKLALIIIVDGVLLTKHQFPKPTARYVTMLSDVQTFLQYPWGRESFKATIETLRPAPKGKKNQIDPIIKFRQKLQSGTMRLQGFPIALQLLAFKSIPILKESLQSSSEEHTLLHIPGEEIATHAGLKLKHVLLAETHQSVRVLLCEYTFCCVCPYYH
ncbi:unnamed protein product [Microthlaspi erraticum]|uniref:DUF1985 domain-containing protein n=1 Tax=Microthlaspi erraticum TaxID=1685480 RepID=A0A6D2JPZ2_9BRAS|nr:unnamed protein product [Microthlaspi erraticum]